MNTILRGAAALLLTILAPLAAQAQRPDISCRAISGTMDDGVAYSYEYRMNLFHQHTTDGSMSYIALVTETNSESGRRTSETVRVREGSAVVALNDSEDLQLSIVLDRATPAQPFGRYFTLMLSTSGGVTRGQLWDDGLLATCLASDAGLEACLGRLSRTLRCRASAR